MVAVCHESRARQSLPGPQPDLRGKLIARTADHSSSREHPQVRQRFGMEKALDRLVQRHTRRDEDGEDDGEAGELLGSEAA